MPPPHCNVFAGASMPHVLWLFYRTMLTYRLRFKLLLYTHASRLPMEHRKEKERKLSRSDSPPELKEVGEASILELSLVSKTLLSAIASGPFLLHIDLFRPLLHIDLSRISTCLQTTSPSYRLLLHVHLSFISTSLTCLCSFIVTILHRKYIQADYTGAIAGVILILGALLLIYLKSRNRNPNQNQSRTLHNNYPSQKQSIFTLGSYKQPPQPLPLYTQPTSPYAQHYNGGLPMPQAVHPSTSGYYRQAGQVQQDNGVRFGGVGVVRY
jgi:hypothetical protein